MRRAAVYVLALFTAVLVSSELAHSLPILGGGPDLLVVTLVAFVSGERGLVAAGYGFGTGLLRDLLLATPMGISALAYALTAYAVGLLGPVRGVWAVLGVVGGATMVSQILYGMGTMVLSASAPTLGSVVQVAFAATVYNMLLTPLLLPLLRRFTAQGAAAEGGAA